MATDLTLMVEHRPGELAKVGEALGSAGINIEGFSATTSGGRGEIHLLVQDAASAKQALDGAGFSVTAESEMVVARVEPKPGELGRVARALADAGVNIELAYPAENGLAFGGDDPAKARGAVGG
jgi:hypothetical protein